MAKEPAKTNDFVRNEHSCVPIGLFNPLAASPIIG